MYRRGCEGAGCSRCRCEAAAGQTDRPTDRPQADALRFPASNGIQRHSWSTVPDTCLRAAFILSDISIRRRRRRGRYTPLTTFCHTSASGGAGNAKRRGVLRCPAFDSVRGKREQQTANVGGAMVTITIPLEKGKGSPYSITERRVPELIPVLGSQPAGDVSHKPDGRLSLLSARPALIVATLKRAATNFAAW